MSFERKAPVSLLRWVVAGLLRRDITWLGYL